jgi:hypothetical protein
MFLANTQDSRYRGNPGLYDAAPLGLKTVVANLSCRKSSRVPAETLHATPVGIL